MRNMSLGQPLPSGENISNALVLTDPAVFTMVSLKRLSYKFPEMVSSFTAQTLSGLLFLHFFFPN